MENSWNPVRGAHSWTVDFIRQVERGDHDPTDPEIRDVNYRITQEVLALEKLLVDYRTKFM